jgi:glycosyltransferase involved in cell wall biosynthesis
VRVLIDYRSALRGRSGVGEYTHELVRALVRAFPPGTEAHALDVTIFSSSWKDRLQIPPDLSGVNAIDLHVPVTLLNFLWHRFRRPVAERLTRSSFDVTHSLHPLLLPASHAAQVVTIHDLNFLKHPERTAREVRRDYPALARRHAHLADRIIVNSHFTAGEVQRELGVAADRISVCSPGAPPWRPREGSRPGGYILFVGTLEPRKNVGGLLDAYEGLIGTRDLPELVIAGAATDQSRRWLERIADTPLAGRVRHLGYVDPADRQALYTGARLLVQPSFEEGFGIPVLEAMTVGVPVVAANRGALPEVTGNAALLVNPDDPSEMAAAMAKMLDDHQLAAACSARGLERAGRYQWDATARNVYEAYRLAVKHKCESV